MLLLQINNLHFSYSSDASIFQGLSLEFLPEKIYGIVGANGSGKTTLFRLLMNVLEPGQGNITLNGLHHLKDRHSYQRSIIFSSDEPEYLPYLTGKEWLEFVLQSYRVRFDADRFGDLVEVFDFAEVHQRTSEYSHGMNKKLSMMINFMVNPSCMIFDESMAGIDPFTLRNIYDYIRESKSGKIILISSHSRELLESCADELLWVREGELHAVKNFEDIFQQE